MSKGFTESHHPENSGGDGGAGKHTGSDHSANAAMQQRGIEPAKGDGGAIDAAGSNVHDTKESLGKATSALGNLVSGKGSAVDAALAVKGAFDSVKGLTGKISESMMMPVMKALGAFKGQAILPAAKQMDPVMGVDVHMVTIPPSPAPIPMPHPYIGILFNTKDFISCAINTFKKDALDALPAPAEGDTGTMASIAKNKEAIAGIAMGLANMGASVKFGSFIPRAITGTPVKNIPHIPMGAGFHPAFAAAVAKNDGKAFLGSLFVVADGDPMVGSFHLNYDCWDIGVIDLFKALRGGGKIKEPEAPEVQAELFVPSGVVTPIPLGRPVLVNSIPTPINPLAILDKLFKAGLGKLKAAAKQGAEKIITSLRGKVGCSALTAASKLVGTGQSHPVDVSGGHFYTDNRDFDLPGPIPLAFERTWYSYSNYRGPLGYGWHHSYDMALAIDNDLQKAAVRLPDGRVAQFDLPAVGGQGEYNRSEKLTLHLHEEKFYYITDKKNLIYRFTQKLYKNPYNSTETFLLQSISNRNGFAIRFAYNNRCVLTQITDSTGRVLTVKNDGDGHITGIDAPRPDNAGETFPIARYTYSDDGDMISHIDALDQAMHFEYVNHLMLKEIWRNGYNWHFRYNKVAGIDAKCIEVWGDGGLLHYRFDYTDPQCTLVTNSLGNLKTFYHNNGVVTKYVDPLGAAWRYRYNKFNELETETDPLGNEYSSTFDERGNKTTKIDPSGGFIQAEFYHPIFPNLQTGGTDATGGKWGWSYDAQGNLMEARRPSGAATTYFYQDGLLKELSVSSGAVTAMGYDKDQNIAFIETDGGIVTRYEYDLLGNCTKIISPNNRVQSRWYDLKARVISLADFDGNQINFEYDGIDNIIVYRDAQKEVKYTYAGMWNLTSRTESDLTIYFVYDSEEQLRKVINENGLPYCFELDTTGRVKQETGFDNKTRTYNRNEAGWVTTVNRPGEKFTTYGYDNCGRVLSVSYSDGKSESYSYRADGELMEAINECARVEFVRDAGSDILQETVNGEWVTAEYDKSGNRITTGSSLGASIRHQFNKMGSVLETEANGWQAKFTYNNLGYETERFLPGGLQSKWQRDTLGRPLVQSVDSAGATRKRRQYQWDINDRLLHMKDEKGTTYFEHDSRNNLSKTTYPDGAVQLRNPDAVGNLYQTENRQDRKYTRGGQLQKANGWHYIYDEEGNLIEKRKSGTEVWLYRWNDAGMLQKVIRPDGEEVIFTYDALGRRLSKQFKNTVTKFLWDGNTPLHEWKEHAFTGQKLSDIKVGSNEMTTWIFDVNSFVPAAKIKGARRYSIVTDYLGTPSQMYNEDGQLFWESELDSYGKVKMEKGDIGSCPFRYQGQYEDVETGLYYNRFRYYAAEEGRFISADPIKLRGGMTLYAYVRDTNRYVDKFGLSFEDLAAKREEKGLPPAGSAGDTSTVSKLQVGNNDPVYGVNSGDQNPKTPMNLDRVNAQTKTHAEADAVQQAINQGQQGTAKTAEMWTDRDACGACGKSGGLRSLARNLGVDELIVHSPSGTKTYTPTK